jgi:DeoR/GlpR family transcriptional regulator of sugar metabolism
MPQNLSIPATAERLGCSPQTVRRLIGEGALEAFRYRTDSGALFVSVQSIEAFLEAKRISAPADADEIGAVA